MSSRTIGRVALVVRDYDEAIAYYTTCLGFSLIEDTPLRDGKRWVLVAPTKGFWRDYQEMQPRGVKFETEPRQEPYGTVAVFVDLYGNRWDLLQLV